MDKKQPLISIITPVHNREKLIVECVKNVQQQTHQNYEHIIIDDGSTDDTVKNVELLLKNDAKIILLKNKENSGGKPGKCRNIGIRQSRGDYIAFLDSDDLWEKNKLEAQLKFMKREKLDISYHPLGRFGESLQNQTSYWGRDCFQRDFFRDLFLSNFIPTCSVLVKKKALEKVGLFDESLKYSEDYALWLILALKNYRFGFLSDVLGGFRRNKHGNINSVLNKVEKNRNDLKLKEKIIFNHKSEVIPRLMKKDLFYSYIFYYYELIKNEESNEQKRALFAEVLDKIFKLNLSAFFIGELETLAGLRKK